jgi:large subunit ribosomal protein L18
MIKVLSRKSKKDIRHKRIRRKLHGTYDIPRLSVYKSLMNIYVQVIDDKSRTTLFAVSTLTPDIMKQIKKEKLNKVDAANIVGKHIASICIQNNIKKARFDRGGIPYTGRVKSLAEGAREAGLII